ncbi:hypothetical protein [Streptomyces sp. 6N223]|uniref:hypothetical protein n=1 Tax=Streptomyces sp. 6N223 TaxID=3457412 RepID=UPI003FD67040
MSYGQGGYPGGPGGPGGPVWNPGTPPGMPPGGPQTPDWSALAADAERRRMRRRLWTIVGSVLAAAAVGTVVALLIVSSGDDSGEGTTTALPSSSDLPPDTTKPQPTFEDTTLPPLPEPRDFISNPEMDIAPFTIGAFFGDAAMEIEGRSYAQRTTEGGQDCPAAVTPDLGTVLTDHGCAALLRATYATGDVAVTVGVAQFPSEQDAEAARSEAVNNLLPLTSGDAPDFCQRGGCVATANQIGRYAYFTIAGNADGSPISGEDTPAHQAARDGNDHAFELIIQRGEAQASASASARVEERENND